jgi:hypothetical protein
VTTLNDLVNETYRRALSGLREEIDTLGVSIGTSDTTISLGAGQTLGSIAPSAIVQVDYELMLVLSAPTTTSITVQRGYLDSTAAAHNAGTLLTVNPRFPAVDVVKAINEDIDSLSSPSLGLYQMLEVTLTYNPVLVGYDLPGVTPSSLIEIHEIRAQEYGPFQQWPLVPMSMYKVQRNADTSIFPSGLALELYKPGYPGRPLRVQYKAAYATPLVNASDDVALVTGLHSQAHDIPVLGAAYRLMQFRELKRSFTEEQTEPRRAQEVPVGSSLTAMKGIMQHRSDRIGEEAARLNAMYRKQWR